MNEVKEKEYDNQTFEDIKHIDENGIEYWYARELMPILQYAKWQNFKKIIDKAMVACKNNEISIEDCFTDISKPIISGKGKQELIEDYKLSRCACYLIIQNGDSRKKAIALAQTYFAIRTRKQEISENDFIANLFIISQTEQKLKRDKIQSEEEACHIYNTVGKIVRNAIKEAEGSKPGDLPQRV